MNRSTIPGLLLGAVLLAGLAAPSAAETVSRTDRRGDAPAEIDVARATYSHDPRRVRVVARIPDLGASGTAVLRISRYEIFEAGYVVRLRQRPGKAARTTLQYFNHFDLEKRPCAGVAGTWGTRKITLSVPRSCLKGHRTASVFTQFGLQSGQQIDDAPWVKRLRRG